MIVKSNKMTPIFARISNSCMALTKPSRWGPARIPLKITPTVTGTRNWCQRKGTTMERPKIMTRSVKMGMGIVLLFL